MKLFEKIKVTKFFDALAKKTRHTEKKYGGECGKEVFVRRTINKWLKNKRLIIYKESEQTGIEYKQYVSITNIQYVLGFGDRLAINLYDVSKPFDIFNTLRLGHNGILRLEGSWDIDKTQFDLLISMFNLDLPKTEFTFKAYDWGMFDEKVNKDGDLESMTTSKTFLAQTEKEAYKLKDKFEKENDGKFMILPNLISPKN
jgi:hypothetical protein